MECTIRTLLRQDIQQLYELEDKELWTLREFSKYILQNQRTGIIAECNHEIIGYSIITSSSNIINIERINISEKYRRQRIGTKLINKLKSFLKINTYNTLYCYIPEERLDIQLFFQYQGFIASEIVGNQYLFKYLYDWLFITHTNNTERITND